MNCCGLLIRNARLEKNWSQEGLCKGICSVPYLSKIEQGKAEPSEEIAGALFARLGFTAVLEKDFSAFAEKLRDSCLEAVFSLDFASAEKLLSAAVNDRERLLHCAFALDFMLLYELVNKTGEGKPLLPVFEPYMNAEQLALQHILLKKYDEAARLFPCAYTLCLCGENAYAGGEALKATELLQKAYDLAAAEGRAGIMLRSRTILGNCCSNSGNIPAMLRHYTVAKRLAATLGEENSLRDIDYNIASTQIEAGNYKEAYAYFSALKNPRLMDLHKLAICCEKLGLKDEALAALRRARGLDPPEFIGDAHIAENMLRLVRFRILNRSYLQSGIYRSLLFSVFDSCRKSLPVGYAVFHLPWVLEWYTSARQYKQAFELLRDFPEYHI